MESSCKNFESHPGVPLVQHLSKVGEAARRRLLEIGVRDERLIQAGELIGKCHDIGKYTEYFQRKIRGHQTSYEFKGELYSHAPISACYAAWAAKQMFGDDPFIIAATMLCVYRHHGNLRNSFNEIYKLLDRVLKNPNYLKQVESISKRMSYISRELRGLRLPDLGRFLTEFRDGLRGVSSVLFQAACRSYEIKDLYTLLLLFSVLIDSDKKTAAGSREIFQRPDVNAYAVDSYLQQRLGTGGGRMAELRRELYRNVIETFDVMLDYQEIPRIITITAPTGSGKTLLSLSVALRLREKIRDTGHKPRIIYVLPYINIIEQTYKVFSEVLGNPPIEVLTKHHHLYYPRDEGDDTPLEEKLMLVESWESEIVVTTFVQFLETLFGTRNSMLKKFHKLYNSIIILDEPQTLPVDYWLLVREAVKALSEESHIIFMTATMPKMLVTKRDGRLENERELVQDCEKYFAKLNRVSYIYEHEQKIVDEAADFVLDKWNGEGSILAIVNKISTSIELYRAIKKRLETVQPLIIEEGTQLPNDCDKVVLAYLSTNITPKERLRRVLLLRDLLQQHKRVVCVSTQLVEAGVDLDFDKVVRDIAPFDSIIQAGGRCNRNWTKDSGTVYIIRLKDGEGNLDSTRIYGNLTICGITQPLLEKWRRWNEDRILTCIREYFELVEDKLSVEYSDESKELLNAVKRLDFEKLGQFKLIKEEPRAAVFVEIDQDAKAVLEDFRRVWKARDENDNRKELRLRRAGLEEYIVETWNVDGLPEERIAEGIDIRYIPYERVDEYYDRETGLKRTAGVQAIFW